jgi:DnaJ-class molecular chaperone
MKKSIIVVCPSCMGSGEDLIEGRGLCWACRGRGQWTVTEQKEDKNDV